MPASFSFSTLLQVCTIDTGPRSSGVGRVVLDVDGASWEFSKIHKIFTYVLIHMWMYKLISEQFYFKNTYQCVIDFCKNVGHLWR